MHLAEIFKKLVLIFFLCTPDNVEVSGNISEFVPEHEFKIRGGKFNGIDFYLLIIRLIYIYSWALIIYILMSWFPNAENTAIGQFLAKICEPYLEPFRKIIPPLG